MTREEMIHLLRSDVRAWNAWKEQHWFMWHDLSGADLSKADLTRAFLQDTTLSKANLNGAMLYQAQILGTFFDQATFKGADFRGARLGYADFDHANFQGADFTNTVIEGGSFVDTNFSHVRLDETTFSNVDLSRTKGLELARHHGPSFISVETIYRSQGKIPGHFLRNAGLPEEFIRHIPSLLAAQEGMAFHSCFISYSHRDEEFTQQLHSRMQDAKLRVWYAPEDVQGGQKLHEQIEAAIRIHDKLLVVLSEASLQSEWVKTEVRNARRQERRTGKRKLFPVRLVDMEAIREWECFDADAGKDAGVEMREYYIPDFSHWKDYYRFEAEFTKLLRDLKAKPSPTF